MLKVGAALFEVGSAVGDLGEEVDELAFFAGGGVVHVDDGGDFVEGEAEAFAAQDEGQADAVAGVVDADVPRRSGVSRPRSS